MSGFLKWAYQAGQAEANSQLGMPPPEEEAPEEAAPPEEAGQPEIDPAVLEQLMMALQAQQAQEGGAPPPGMEGAEGAPPPGAEGAPEMGAPPPGMEGMAGGEGGGPSADAFVQMVEHDDTEAQQGMEELPPNDEDKPVHWGGGASLEGGDAGTRQDQMGIPGSAAV